MDDVTVATQRVLNRIVQVEDACWVWTGRVDRDGYGLQWVGPKPTRKLRFTHRLVYTHLIGEIAEGMELDHLCRNRRCCNPTHLEPVTTQENTRRGVEARTTCRRGHEITPDTSYRAPQGYRACRICRREADAQWKKRHRARV